VSRDDEERAQLVSIQELAELLRVPVTTVYRWRYTGNAPRGIRVGRHVRFAMADVFAWMEERKS
jgi:excisionase family DNA binding protein